MALSPAFTCVSYNTPLINPALGGLIDPTAMQFNDISTGSDGAIVSRQILLYNVQGNLAVPAIPWPLVTNPITINPLTQDAAFNIVVQWLNSSGVAIYTASQILPFTGFGESFFYNLIETESGSPTILQDVNYQNNKGTLRGYLDAAITSVTIGQNQGNSQACIIKEQYIVTNQNDFF